MTKKRLLLIASMPFTVAVTLGVLAMLPPSPGVTKANFDRIEIGMTRAEVEEIFGRKGVDNRERDRAVWFSGANDVVTDTVVWFKEDCVVGKVWHDSNETITDKIRRWLHLP